MRKETKMLALSLGLAAALIWAVHDLLARKLSQGAALLPIILVVIGSGSVALIGPSLAFGNWQGLSNKAISLAVAAGFAYALQVAHYFVLSAWLQRGLLPPSSALTRCCRLPAPCFRKDQ